MRGSALVASLALVLSAAPVFAQAPAGQPATPPPATAKPPAPAGQPAAPPAPAGQPGAPPAPAAAPQPPAPFPQGAKVGYVNLQMVAQLSNEGKAAAAKVQALTTKKQAEIAERTKNLQGAQQKLQTGGGVMSEQARGQLEKDIERQNKELERFQQDAQAELNELQQELQAAFQTRLFPILDQLSLEKGLHLLFSGADAGLIWAAPGLDLTADAVKKLDAAPAPKPGVKP
jgi:outer membrane protein